MLDVCLLSVQLAMHGITAHDGLSTLYSHTVFLRSDAMATVFFFFFLLFVFARLLFEDCYYSRAVFISLENPQTSMMVCTGDTLMTVRCCQ